jgi:hypothetical protein
MTISESNSPNLLRLAVDHLSFGATTGRVGLRSPGSQAMRILSHENVTAGESDLFVHAGAGQVRRSFRPHNTDIFQPSESLVPERAT